MNRIDTIKLIIKPEMRISISGMKMGAIARAIRRISSASMAKTDDFAQAIIQKYTASTLFWMAVERIFQAITLNQLFNLPPSAPQIRWMPQINMVPWPGKQITQILPFGSPISPVKFNQHLLLVNMTPQDSSAPHGLRLSMSKIQPCGQQHFLHPILDRVVQHEKRVQHLVTQRTENTSKISPTSMFLANSRNDRPSDTEPSSQNHPSHRDTQHLSPVSVAEVEPIPRVVRQARLPEPESSFPQTAAIASFKPTTPANTEQLSAIVNPTIVNQLTDQVMLAIDRRLIAYRERTGRM